MPKRIRCVLLLALAAAAAQTGYIFAWWPEGHRLTDEAAVLMLPADMPEFFRNSAATLTAYSSDPDVWKNKELVALYAAEGPEHYLDLELLKGNRPPATRRKYVELCRKLDVDPDKVGFLPYAIDEWYGRLVLAFAEYRRWPDDERVKAKILYLAGVLSHYTSDAGMPLHCTIHFDGRVKSGGSSPRTGIHNKMDALPGVLGLKADAVAAGSKVAAVGDVFKFTCNTIYKSNSRVERVYELEAKLPPAPTGKNYENRGAQDKELVDFCVVLCRTSAELTATVWYSAWVNSGRIRLPDWYELGRDMHR